MSGPQYMPFYVGDYLRDTMHLTREQHGAYLLLLFACWAANGQLPDNDDILSSIAKATRDEWLSLKPLLSKYFSVADNFWRHKRVDKELRKTQRLHKARSKAGSKGAAKRDANRKQTLTKQSLSSQSQSQSYIASNEAIKDSPPSGGRAPNGRAAPPDDEINEKGVVLFGHRKRGLIRQLRLRFGDDRVRDALAATERRQPAEPLAYFVSCCEHRNGAAEPTGPPEPQHTGPRSPPPKYFNPEDDPDYHAKESPNAQVEGLRH